MGEMRNFEAEAAELVRRGEHRLGKIFHHPGQDHPSEDIPAIQENPMTTPQQVQVQQSQPQRVVDSLHAITGEIQANALVARLIQYGVGKLLTAQEADHFVALMVAVEEPHRQAAANVPAADNGGQQQGATAQ